MLINIPEGGVIEAFGPVADHYLSLPGHSEVITEEQAEERAEELHGAELDAALEAKGLPKTGKVAEKQERLAAALTTDPGPGSDDTKTQEN